MKSLSADPASDSGCSRRMPWYSGHLVHQAVEAFNERAQLRLAV